MSGRGPVLLRGAMPAAMAPGRANGLYVVVVGEGECRPFLRGRSEQPSIPLESASTGGYKKDGRLIRLLMQGYSGVVLEERKTLTAHDTHESAKFDTQDRVPRHPTSSVFT